MDFLDAVASCDIMLWITERFFGALQLNRWLMEWLIAVCLYEFLCIHPKRGKLFAQQFFAESEIVLEKEASI